MESTEFQAKGTGKPSADFVITLLGLAERRSQAMSRGLLSKGNPILSNCAHYGEVQDLPAANENECM